MKFQRIQLAAALFLLLASTSAHAQLAYSELLLWSPNGILTVKAPNLNANRTFTFPDPGPNQGTFLMTSSSGGQTMSDGLTVNGGLTLGTALGMTNGGTGIGNNTKGDMLYADANNSWAKLAAGATGSYLSVSASGIPEWVQAPSVTVTAPVSLTSSASTDGSYTLKAVESAGGSNQVIGLWGSASGSSTKGIGVLAEGNGSTTAANTNIALNVRGGSLNVGRTATDANGNNTVPAAEDDATTSDNGPSGVIDFTSVVAAPGNSNVSSGTQVVYNPYVTSNSIIILTILNLDDANVANNKEAISAGIEGRANGSFTIRITRCKPGSGGTLGNWNPRVGYLIINPNK